MPFLLNRFKTSFALPFCFVLFCFALLPDACVQFLKALLSIGCVLHAYTCTDY